MIGIIGFGHVGKVMAKLINREEDIVIYDKNYNYCCSSLVSQSKDDINKCDYVFICVPTNRGKDGLLDLTEVNDVLSWCTVKNVCIKSTVPVGTIDKLDNRYCGNRNFVFSPEYYGETLNHPYKYGSDWLVIGGKPEATKIFANLMQEWYPNTTTIHCTDAKTAELAKFMENAYLATKVTFCNAFYDIAESLGVDYYKLRETWLLDPRIGSSHTMVYPRPGKRGYGGKCLPKDILSIFTQCNMMNDNRLSPAVNFLNSVIDANKEMSNPCRSCPMKNCQGCPEFEIWDNEIFKKD